MIERKALEIELKAGLTVTGEFQAYGSVFGNTDAHNDIVVSGAFAKSLRDHASENTWPKMFWSHDPNAPIGDWLEIEEDERGLKMTGKLWIDEPRVDDAVKAYRSMKSPRGTMGASIGYRTVRAEIDRKTGARRLLELKLLEVSPTPFPANQLAGILAAKSGEITLRQCEALLRAQCGFSRKEAAALLDQGFKGLTSIARDERETEVAHLDPGARDELTDEFQNLLASLKSAGELISNSSRN